MHEHARWHVACILCDNGISGSGGDLALESQELLNE